MWPSLPPCCLRRGERGEHDVCWCMDVCHQSLMEVSFVDRPPVRDSHSHLVQWHVMLFPLVCACASSLDPYLIVLEYLLWKQTRNSCRCLLCNANIVKWYRGASVFCINWWDLVEKNLSNMNDYIPTDCSSFHVRSAMKGRCIRIWIEAKGKQKHYTDLAWAFWLWTSKILSGWGINRTFWSSSFWLTQRARLD